MAQESKDEVATSDVPSDNEVAKEATVAKETPITEEATVTKETPAAKETPITEEATVTKETPAAKETPITQQPKAEVTDIKTELAKAVGAVDALKNELAKVDSQKEKAFKQKQDVGGKIVEKIKLINEFKAGRNSLTKEVQDLKKQRDVLNNQINERVQEIKKLTKGKPIPKPQRGKGEDSPGMLKKKIEQLEYKLETQPMGFEAETKVNKEIKEIKKKLGAQMELFEGAEEVMSKSKEIDKLKKEANELHAKVTKVATESQKRHEDLIAHSKEIEDLKKQEEEFYNQFVEYKKLHGELLAKLKTKIGVSEQSDTVVRKERVNAKRQKEAEDKKTLKERVKEAEEKIKKKEKLTTEDLLAMQAHK